MNTASNPGTPPRKDNTEAKIAGLAVSADHHSKIIQQFSYGVVYLLSIFDAGAFTATIAVLPTSFGTAMRAEHPYLVGWSIFFFLLGFVMSLCTIASIIAFSLAKYRLYRGTLRDGLVDTLKDKEPGVAYHAHGWFWFSGSLVVSLTGASFLTYVVLSAP